MIKSIIQSILVYNMTTFFIPKSICNDLDSLVRHFWWKGSIDQPRYIVPLAWDAICKPKSRGGLGILWFRDINLAYMAKLGWILAWNSTIFWSIVLRTKYCYQQSFWIATLPKSASLIVCSIWSTRKFIRKISYFR